MIERSGRGEPPAERRVIGRRTPLIDGRAKASGDAVYTDDIKLPGCLVGKILRSPLPHARIVKIDTSKAEAIPGVRAIVTGRDSRVKFGVLPISRDETAMAVDKVRYIGDCVAAIAADDEEIALEAIGMIDVVYEELPACLRIEDGLRPVEEPIHPDRSIRGTNIMKEVDQHFGDVPKALEGAAHRITDRFEFVGVTHAFTEPHAAIAYYGPDDRLTVWTATQVPYYVHRALAEVMEMPMHRIRVIKPAVGGGFGGKSDPFPHEMCAALLSRRCRRPVKILFDREEVFLTNHGRHPTRQEVTIGVDGEGRIRGLDVGALIDGGAWSSFGVVTTYYNGVLSIGPYEIPNFRYSGKRVYTNKPPCGAMRAHGAVNTRFAVEVVIDRVAEAMGIDPCDLRLRNFMPPNTTTINEFRITSNGVRECLEKVRDASRWNERFGKMPFGEGIGVACGFYISGSAHPIHRMGFPQSTVHLKVDIDGGVTVHTGASEIGQGSDTMVAQVVAEVLGLDLGWIRVHAVDSDISPIDIGSYSSRVTFMNGNAARRAAEKIRAELVEAAARLTGYPHEGFVLRDEKVVFAPRPSISVHYLEALRAAMAEGGALVARGAYKGPPPMGGKFKGAAAGLSPSYSFNAAIAKVKVDTETGEVRVEKVWVAHDCGRALNPLSVEGQIEGSIHMGLGQVLQESMDFHRGSVINPNLLDYRPLSSLQMPEVEVFIVESDDPEGPFGAKEAGEGPLLPALPAVANAIYDAVGVRMNRLPITPDRVFEALERKRKRDPSQVPASSAS